MMDINTIARGVSRSIYSLSNRSEDYGTGYDVLISKSSVTLQLMDGPASTGKIVRELNSTNKSEVEVVTDLERQVLELT